jgi:hypothetical protein
MVARNSDIEHRLRAYEDYPWTTEYPEPLKQNRCLDLLSLFFVFFQSIYRST